MTIISTTGFELAEWQRAAVKAWKRGDRRAPFRGTLEIFTGGGKTLIALAALAEVSRINPGVRAVVVVPTEALAHQWLDVLRSRTNLPERAIGLLGAGGQTVLSDVRVLVAVINTAAKVLPNLSVNGEDAMLIVDECHRAGAPTFRRVLDFPARFRLGLSATPEREELDEEGLPLDYDEQILGRKLGEVVYRFNLAAARKAGWLPEFAVHHHGVTLGPEERRRYERISSQIDALATDLQGTLGTLDPRRIRQIASSQSAVTSTAQAWLAATAKRGSSSGRHRAGSLGNGCTGVLTRVAQVG